ncbi:MAG: hypothetical protein HRT60_13120 [Dinoroseobacter sp.]|nr:hypothetical protein [Dinoroseobacter sp.]
MNDSERIAELEKQIVAIKVAMKGLMTADNIGLLVALKTFAGKSSDEIDKALNDLENLESNMLQVLNILPDVDEASETKEAEGD